MTPSPHLRHKAAKVFRVLTGLRVNYVFDTEQTYPEQSEKTFYKPIQKKPKPNEISTLLGPFSLAWHWLDLFPR